MAGLHEVHAATLQLVHRTWLLRSLSPGLVRTGHCKYAAAQLLCLFPPTRSHRSDLEIQLKTVQVHVTPVSQALAAHRTQVTPSLREQELIAYWLLPSRVLWAPWSLSHAAALAVQGAYANYGERLYVEGRLEALRKEEEVGRATEAGILLAGQAVAVGGAGWCRFPCPRPCPHPPSAG